MQLSCDPDVYEGIGALLDKGSLSACQRSRSSKQPTSHWTVDFFVCILSSPGRHAFSYKTIGAKLTNIIHEMVNLVHIYQLYVVKLCRSVPNSDKLDSLVHLHNLLITVV